MLTFLHLSDIHFSELDGPEGRHVDERVRELMLDDIKLMAERVGAMDGVLLVGDVANAGKEGDYRLASEFLDSAANLIGCDADKVVCVPGNHDIDRDAHDALHQAVRDSLRTVEPEEISSRLHALLSENRSADVLLEPLAEYNRFALRYGCAIDQGEVVWTPKEFDLDGSPLVVHGATSAWICDATDSFETDRRRVVVGDFQCCHIGNPMSVAMIHHPARWVRDKARVQPWLNRAQVILTGHEHAAGIEPDPDGRRIVIASGAVNPERTKRGWVPAYNVICLERQSEDELQLTIYVRSWQGEAEVAEFGHDDRFADPYSLTVALNRRVVGEAELPEPHEAPPAQEPEPIESESRTLVFEIMRAAPDRRHRAARALELVEEDDGAGLALDRHILKRARERGQLPELKARIDDD